MMLSLLVVSHTDRDPSSNRMHVSALHRSRWEDHSPTRTVGCHSNDRNRSSKSSVAPSFYQKFGSSRGLTVIMPRNFSTQDGSSHLLWHMYANHTSFWLLMKFHNHFSFRLGSSPLIRSSFTTFYCSNVYTTRLPSSFRLTTWVNFVLRYSAVDSGKANVRDGRDGSQKGKSSLLIALSVSLRHKETKLSPQL